MHRVATRRTERITAEQFAHAGQVTIDPPNRMQRHLGLAAWGQRVQVVAVLIDTYRLDLAGATGQQHVEA
jgi:hypothetical protein